MAYSERLVQRVRKHIGSIKGLSEKRMFGGLAFLLEGKMVCGIVGDELMARVGPDAYGEALKKKHARPMDFTGRPLKGFVFVSSEGCKSGAGLKTWVARSLKYAESLPAKKAKSRHRR